MKKVLINIRYFMAPLLILVSMIGVLVGGQFAWTGVVLFGVGILLDTLSMPMHTKGAGFDENGETNGIPGLQNAVMYIMLPIFALLQVVMAWRIYQYVNGVPVEPGMFMGFPIQMGMTGAELIGATISTGIFAGIGIIYGHELAHTKGFSFVISRWMMALSGSSHFCYAHVYNHHLELAHQDDPATSPRGRSIYRHFWLSHMGQSKFLYKMEEARLKRLGKSFISLENRWIRGYFMSLPTFILFAWAGGPIGVACMFLIWTISNFELEALNYMEHYGLIREKGQPIDYRHSWDNDNMFTSWFFIEIGRQGDHHDRGETHFWELDEVGSPNPGWGYFTEFSMALVPPLWHSVYKKKLATWDRDFASEGEQAIAARVNAEVGYEVNDTPSSYAKI
ncbi:fatty acid desaturase [Methylophaga sulfidovorans]|uniref:Alkane 1-monooxygenase n=1 Tax=Methylophaga sulfidovorans TaxID=45496 RepID=A0A1I3UAA1_9GAMM|nr:fatty acid desaturase [Methylophaga sulfidovorans]SFJ80434.1 alkane 1-monooxygenase [Methylophaga sulfidovorans]